MGAPAGMVPGQPGQPGQGRLTASILGQPNEGGVPAMAPVAQVSCRREGGVCR